MKRNYKHMNHSLRFASSFQDNSNSKTVIVWNEKKKRTMQKIRSKRKSLKKEGPSASKKHDSCILSSKPYNGQFLEKMWLMFTVKSWIFRTWSKRPKCRKKKNRFCFFSCVLNNRFCCFYTMGVAPITLSSGVFLYNPS